jgi:hypothetical protein
MHGASISCSGVASFRGNVANGRGRVLERKAGAEAREATSAGNRHETWHLGQVLRPRDHASHSALVVEREMEPVVPLLRALPVTHAVAQRHVEFVRR